MLARGRRSSAALTPDTMDVCRSRCALSLCAGRTYYVLICHGLEEDEIVSRITLIDSEAVGSRNDGFCRPQIIFCVRLLSKSVDRALQVLQLVCLLLRGRPILLKNRGIHYQACTRDSLLRHDRLQLVCSTAVLRSQINHNCWLLRSPLRCRKSFVGLSLRFLCTVFARAASSAGSRGSHVLSCCQ